MKSEKLNNIKVDFSDFKKTWEKIEQEYIKKQSYKKELKMPDNYFINPNNNDWMLGIKKVDNGFILQFYEGNIDDEGKKLICEEVTETVSDALTSDYKKFEMEKFSDMLYKIQDFFGFTYSKHNEYNIITKVVNTREHEEKEDEITDL